MTAVLVVLLILVGLPLVAWWVGSRRAWTRIDARARDSVTAERTWIARHGLSVAEQIQVDRAIARGRRVEDPRLGPAVVERAQMVLESLDTWGSEHPRWAAAVRWLRIVWVLLLVVLLVFAVFLGDWSPALPFYLVAAVGAFVANHLQRRNIHRAIAVNSDPASGEE